MTKKSKLLKVILVLGLIAILFLSTKALKNHKGETSSHTTAQANINKTSKITTINKGTNKGTKYVKLPYRSKSNAQFTFKLR